MLIVTVCRTGPEYGIRQAQYLHRQLDGYESVCMTDLPEIPGVRTMPLRNPMWPGWWAKMELFDIAGEHASRKVLYLDLDTKIVGSLEPLFDATQQVEDLVMLQDFYRPDRLASGIMLITPKARAQVWPKWKQRPRAVMMSNHLGGDGRAIERFAEGALAWQKLLPPNTIVSYKKHVVAPDSPFYKVGRSQGDGTIPAGAQVVCYHGNPRPWNQDESDHSQPPFACMDAGRSLPQH